ncbi:alpha/beta hydrolase [Chitinophaga sp. G-6-1-13]|uniref:Alpha/beta hydrolase n=2 Tax=Chitinophaga fulva TaxID=2728842 RepID=A0A848GTG4_9BACT|nr:alpha/beta hydrolase [Chitinophaga fulva]
MKEINIDHSKIAYYEQGKGETIILLHGWPQTSYVWRKNFSELSKHNRVIAVDLPGLGKSEKVEKYDTKSIATLIDKFTDSLKIDKFHLVGHDIGSWVAVTYAIFFERKLSTLTVIDASIPGLMDAAVFRPENANKVWQFYFHAVDAIPEFLTDGKEKEYISWYFTKKSFIKTAINKDDLQTYYNDYKGTMKNGFDYYRAFGESAKQNQSFSGKLSIPVLAIGGRYALAERVGDAIRKIADHVQVETIEECGHYVPEEQPEQINKLILTQIKK